MILKPGKLSFWGVMAIVFFGDLFIFLLFPFGSISIIETVLTVLSIFSINAVLAIFLLLEYKTFILSDRTLVIRSTFFKFLKPFSADTGKIERIRIIRYAIQNRIAPVIIVSFFDNERKQEKMKFRMEDQRIEFQNFLKMLRDEGVVVECEGDVWF